MTVSAVGSERVAVPGRGTVADELLARWPLGRAFLVVGSGCTIAGGLVSAVTRPTGFALGSWTAAYLVLVGGVAQIALGVGQAWLAEPTPLARRVRAEAVAWNIGVAATVAGTVAGVPLITTAAGLALTLALGLFFVTTRARGSVRRAARGWYRALVLLLLVSIPIGVVLAWIRHI